MASEPFKPPVRRRGQFFYADMALCLGPPSIGDKGAATLRDLFGTPWTLQLEGKSSLGLRVLTYSRWNGSVWVQSGVFEGPANAEHVTLAFDQSARPVAAYEATRELAVRYWDEAQQTFKLRTFGGYDPVLINDALAHYRLEDSDVVLFYLSSDRRRVLARIQRERYDTEHEVATLSEPAYLDQVVPLAYQLGLLLSREADTVALLSELYPVRAADAHRATVGALRGGLYKTNLVLYEGGDNLGSSLSALQGGSYDENLQQYRAQSSHSAALGALRGGEFRSIYLLAFHSQAVTSSLTALQGGEFKQSVLPYSRNPDTVSGAVGALRGGSYDEV